MRSMFARLSRRYGPKLLGAERQRLVKDKLESLAPLPSPEQPARLQARAALAKRLPQVAIIGGGLAGSTRTVQLRLSTVMRPWASSAT